MYVHVSVCVSETEESEVRQKGSLACTRALRSTKKHAPAHLFPLTAEEGDGSLQDEPEGG